MSVPAGYTVTPTTGTYGVETTFTLQNGSAGAGDVAIVITDDQAGGDTENVTITDPNTCSTNSNITNVGSLNISCNNNGTAGDPNDDAITITLNPVGFNLALDYIVIPPAGYTVSPINGVYGAPTQFSFNGGSAGGGDFVFDVVDNQAGGVQVSVSISDPGTCSTTSTIIDNGIQNVNCENNSTPGNPTDDYVVFSLTPYGYNLGVEYTVTVPMGYTVTPSTGTFGTNTTFQFSLQVGSAGSGSVQIVITDNQPNGDVFTFSLNDPGTCSGESYIETAGFDSLLCNDNGTPNNIYDDFITFDLDPFGYNLSGDYTLLLPQGLTTNPNGGIFGDTTSFVGYGFAGQGNVTMQIIDNQVDGDTLEVLVMDLGFCSTKPEIVITDTVIIYLDTVTYCLDADILPGDTLTISDICSDANGEYVEFTIDQVNLCVTYMGIDFIGADSLCLEVVDEFGNTDTIIFNITSISPPSIDCISEIIFVNQEKYFCIDTSQLVGNIISIENVCADSTFVKYEVIDSNFCVSYEGRALGNAEACIVITDDLGISDTTYFCTEVVRYFGDLEAHPDEFCVTMNTPGVYDILGNDIAFGGVDSLYFLSIPMYGEISINPDLSITYTPYADICERTDELIYEYCTPDAGCMQSVVHICIECDDIVIFTAVSPNGDGVNDKFYISNIEDYPQNELTIFNRWGNQVHHAKSYRNGWDGTWRDKYLPDGSYYYVLNLNDPAGRKYSGYLQIQR